MFPLTGSNNLIPPQIYTVFFIEATINVSGLKAKRRNVGANTQNRNFKASDTYYCLKIQKSIKN